MIKSGAWLVLGLRRDKSNHIKLHAGTYYLQNEKTFKQIGKSIVELVISLKSDGNSIIVSGVIPIFDNINNKVNKINHHVALMCWQRNISFISHSEAIDSSEHLNDNKLHLMTIFLQFLRKNFQYFWKSSIDFNHNVFTVFAENFSVFLKKFIWYQQQKISLLMPMNLILKKKAMLIKPLTWIFFQVMILLGPKKNLLIWDKENPNRLIWAH